MDLKNVYKIFYLLFLQINVIICTNPAITTKPFMELQDLKDILVMTQKVQNFLLESNFSKELEDSEIFVDKSRQIIERITLLENEIKETANKVSLTLILKISHILSLKSSS